MCGSMLGLSGAFHELSIEVIGIDGGCVKPLSILKKVTSRLSWIRFSRIAA